MALWMGSVAGGLAAQSAAPAWGTSAESVLAIGAYEFQTYDDSFTFGADFPTFQRFLGIGGLWFAAISLPSGALVTAIELQGCDETITGRWEVGLHRQEMSPGPTLVQVAGPFSTGLANLPPHCTHYSFPLAVPVVIDNSDGFYVVMLSSQPGSGEGIDLRFAGVRLKYRLQVSPAPASATFNDVPTGHPFFRFVEALAASGITAGCGGNNYCPNAPITRGEMAVFLAAALGLHFPN
jgi:hypothetical protein